MRSSFKALLILHLLAPLGSTASVCPPEAELILRDAKQLVLVQTADWNTLQAQMSWWERRSPRDGWQKVKSAIPAVVGRAGLAWGFEFAALPSPWRTPSQPVKHEGDGRTPAGIHRLGRKFGFAPQAGGDFLRLVPSTVCVDDPQSRHYNEIVDSSKTSIDWKSAEKMREIDAYKIGFVVDYRSNAGARSGSCIFAHIWNGPDRGTAGCLATSEDRVGEMQTWIKAESHPAIGFLTSEDLRGPWTECLNLAN